MSDGPLLKVDGLATRFYTEEWEVPAVDGVSFEIGKGETLGLVGESGCGKSVTAMSLVRLIPQPMGRIVGGEVVFGGRRLDRLPVEEMWKVRGRDIGVIFQEPMSSLNPVYAIGRQLREVLELHESLPRAEADRRVEEMLRHVRIPSPADCMKRYPHELSGGMLQRVMIAMALLCRPKLLIADEPTTALDVTIQAQILDLIRSLQKEMGMAVLMITHDLGVIAETAHRVAVMYTGRIVETAPARSLFKKPRHPYTEGLLASLPILHGGKEELYSIPGNVPSPRDYPPGCRFAPRCPLAEDRCRREVPRLSAVDDEHLVACWVRGAP